MKKKLVLWHPESPGIKVVVYRGWLKRLVLPVAFATLNETLNAMTRIVTVSPGCDGCIYDTDRTESECIECERYYPDCYTRTR